MSSSSLAAERLRAPAQMSDARLVAHKLRYDLPGVWGDPQSRSFTIVLPLIFLVLLTSLFGNQTLHVHGHAIKTSTYGRVVYGVHLPGATLPAFLLGLIVGAAAFCWLSFAAANFIRNEDSAQPLIQAITLPLYFISGVLVPTDQLSSTLREIASVFPVSHLESALFKAFDPATTGSGIAVTDLLILAIRGAAGLLIALRRFKWSPQST